MPIDYSKPQITLLPFLIVSWDNQVRRYVRADSALTINGDLFAAVPELAINAITTDGGIEPQPHVFVVPSSLDPFTRLIYGVMPKVTVSIGELDADEPSTPPRIMAQGDVSKTITNFQGRPGLMQVSLATAKDRLQEAGLGIKCSAECGNIFGTLPCRATVASVTATVESINNTTLVLVSLPADTNKGAWLEGRYTRGYVLRGGLRIMIRKHSVGTRTLITAKPAPVEWVGQVVTVFEGCDKSQAACTAHGATASWMGLGVNMPPYNPLLEQPQQ